MRLKHTVALLLSSAMMMGTVGGMSPIQVMAETPAGPTNQYTLTVPAETTLAPDGSAVELTNGLRVSDGDLEDGMKVTVIATASASRWNLRAAGVGTSIRYGLYASSDATQKTTSWEFSKEEASGTGTTKAVYSRITKADYESARPGDYTDTITFTASVVDARTVSYPKSSGLGELSAKNLGEAKKFTYNETVYDVYNDFIPSSAGSSWQDATEFVAALNDAKFDGHDDWKLLQSEEMAREWYRQFKDKDRGDVKKLWARFSPAAVNAYVLICYDDIDEGGCEWKSYVKTKSDPEYGFVVLRGTPSN